VSRVRIGSVASDQDNEALCRLLQSMLAVPVELARVVSPCSGIQCGYESPSLLGVDRWLAVLAAANEFGTQNLLVVDAGSAITLDYVGSGRHLGGFIGPGLHMMRAALFAGTAKVKVPEMSDGFPVAPAVNTASAVSGALRLMHLGLVEQAQKRFSAKAQIVLTGGDAQILLSELEGAVWRPDLVLDGLRLALP
jgi:type III pantothenate kinase